MDLSDFPFHCNFQSAAKIIIPNDYQEQMAKASLDSLRGLLPDGVDPSEDPDLLYFVANGAVAGMCNLNDDCLDPNTALRIFPKTKNKYINVDHKKEIVVGTILYPGVSKYGTSLPLTPDEALIEPIFNLSLVGVVWRAISPRLSMALIEGADLSSSRYGDISLSWEIYFKDYDIAIGSKILKEAKVITDQDEKEKYKPFLRCNGGEGFYEGEKIYRVFRNTPESENVIIAGYSWVANPAAAVKGLAIIDKIEVTPAGDDDNKNDDANSSVSNNHLKVGDRVNLKNNRGVGNFWEIVEINGDSVTLFYPDKPEKRSFEISKVFIDEKKNNENNEKSISHQQKLFVEIQTDKNKIMDIKTLEDISANWQEFSKLEQSIACSQISAVFKAGIEKASEDYTAKINAEKEAVAESKRQLKEVQDSLAEIKARSEASEKELAEVRKLQEAAAHQEKYNERLAEIDEEFDLEAEDRTVLASEIMGLDDESYAKFKKKFDILANLKNKKVKAEREDKLRKEFAEQLKSKASTKTQEEIAAEALASAKGKEKQGVITPSIDPNAESLLDKYKNAFNPSTK